MSSNTNYDYIIIGGGLAGLQLALAMAEENFFENKSIAILEAEAKIKNDKTWCYWEKGSGKWDSIIHHQWKSGKFKSDEKQIKLNMGDYSYKMIQSADFYREAKVRLNKVNNIFWINDKIEWVNQNHCYGKTNSYHATVVFDSRVSADFFKDSKHIKVKQPFKGWFIKTEAEQFDPNSFTIMDYSLVYKDLCCFAYVLPTSTTEALVEATFFTPHLVEDKVYDKLLDSYITNKLNIKNFEIEAIEQGIIPMSTYPFRKENRSNYLKIGTGGGWVKPSSGYSFKSTEKKVSQLIENIKHKKPLDQDLFSEKFLFYDRIFLRILQEENHLGNQLFQEMFFKNSCSKIFKFLDEETNLAEEIKIINRFSKGPFLRSLLKEIR